MKILLSAAALSAVGLALQWPVLAPDVQAAVLACWIASLVFALWHWAHSWKGTLVWDGQHWSLVAGSQAVEVIPTILVDLQSAVLLRIAGPASPSVGRGWPGWIWADTGRSGNSPGGWIALRRALVFAARRPPEGGAVPSGPADQVDGT